MARKHLNGQLNIFDLLNNWEGPAMGEEVEMVSLMPELEDEVEPVAETQEVQELQIEPEAMPQKSSTKKAIRKAVEKSAKPVLEETANLVVEELPVLEASEEEFIEPPAPAKKRKPTNFNEKVVMHRKFKKDGKEMDIAYLSYNKVRIRMAGEEDQILEFASSKEAVDFYVDRIQELDE